jgi:hypothetical protein
MTARTLYSCTMSLDGFMAGPGGDMHWLLPFFGPDPVADIVLERTGSLLVGRRTFTGDDPTPEPRRRARSAAPSTARRSCSPTSLRATHRRTSPS